MKAILVIDVDDERFTHAKVSLSYKDEDGWWADVNYETLPLRPMPNRMDYVHGADITVNMFANGWNSCLNEIDPEWDVGVKPWR